MAGGEVDNRLETAESMIDLTAEKQEELCFLEGDYETTGNTSSTVTLARIAFSSDYARFLIYRQTIRKGLGSICIIYFKASLEQDVLHCAVQVHEKLSLLQLICKGTAPVDCCYVYTPDTMLS